MLVDVELPALLTLPPCEVLELVPTLFAEFELVDELLADPPADVEDTPLTEPPVALPPCPPAPPCALDALLPLLFWLALAEPPVPMSFVAMLDALVLVASAELLFSLVAVFCDVFVVGVLVVIVGAFVYDGLLLLTLLLGDWCWLRWPNATEIPRIRKRAVILLMLDTSVSPGEWMG